MPCLSCAPLRPLAPLQPGGRVLLPGGGGCDPLHPGRVSRPRARAGGSERGEHPPAGARWDEGVHAGVGPGLGCFVEGWGWAACQCSRAQGAGWSKAQGSQLHNAAARSNRLPSHTRSHGDRGGGPSARPGGAARHALARPQPGACSGGSAQQQQEEQQHRHGGRHCWRHRRGAGCRRRRRDPAAAPQAAAAPDQGPPAAGGGGRGQARGGERQRQGRGQPQHAAQPERRAGRRQPARPLWRRRAPGQRIQGGVRQRQRRADGSGGAGRGAAPHLGRRRLR